jgi:hypothetical protein
MVDFLRSIIDKVKVPFSALSVYHCMSRFHRTKKEWCIISPTTRTPIPRIIVLPMKVKFLSTLNKFKIGIVIFLPMGRAVLWPFLLLQKWDSLALSCPPDLKGSSLPWRNEVRQAQWPSRWGRGPFSSNSSLCGWRCQLSLPLYSGLWQLTSMHSVLLFPEQRTFLYETWSLWFGWA